MHKHNWKRSARKHGNPAMFFVQCEDPDCGVVMQAVIRYGHMHVFNTGTNRGGKSKIKSYRLKSWQEARLKEQGRTFVQFVDEAFTK